MRNHYKWLCKKFYKKPSEFGIGIGIGVEIEEGTIPYVQDNPSV